ncbi:MAG: GNAT family N-acetyltransferase [Candidatus Nealsonbacteria bacterium]|nr:GNAT family N-acetyltransferase [Candidatus Nealsonbacteria bacterium]
MENKFLKITNKNEWQDLLNKVFLKTFFHNQDWEEFLEKEFPWLKFEHYSYGDKALLSLARVRVFGKEKLISHPFCEYGGPLPLVQSIDWAIFEKDLLEEFKEPLRIRFHPKVVGGLTSGFRQAEINTYFIEDLHIKTKEQLLNSFRKTLRHLILGKHPINIGLLENDDDLKYLYKLYVQTAKRNMFLPRPFSFFRFFRNSKDAKIVLARHRNKVIAGSIFLFYDKFIQYALNASDWRFGNFYPNHLILWQEIFENAGGKYEVFDLGGTGVGSELEVFKSGWGAKKYPIFEISNVKKEGHFRGSKLRKILPFLPDFLFKKLSSRLLKYKL